MRARHRAWVGGRVATFVLPAMLTAAACDGAVPQRAGPSLDLGADSMGMVPDARRIPVRGPRALEENSGAAMSMRQPGVWFTINDSGHDPVLYALDTAGRSRGAWRIAGARNRDWESVALGPCGGAAGEHCLYIGEVGDNGARHPSVILYRVREPDAGGSGALSAAALEFEYEGGPRDVEATYVGPDGTVFLISKRALRDAADALRPALVFAVPPDAWSRTGTRHVAALIDSLPIVPGSALGRQVTGATLSRDGRAAAVRTYTQLYVFRADSATGRIVTNVPPTVCSIGSLEEEQGEGVTWFAGTGDWLLTSEGRDEPLWVVRCPAPALAP